MQFRVGVGVSAAALVLLAAACQGTPPITYVMEVTREVTRIVTADPAGTSVAQNPNGGPLPIGTHLATPTPANRQTQTALTVTVTVTPNATSSITATPAMTATPDVFPTPVVGQIYVAEQKFQNGRLFWLQPIEQIWVATTDKDGKQVWLAFADTFVDGEPEINPTLTPPVKLIQPERGFGKLWRDNREVQSLVGWAQEAEFGYVTRYEYRAGGTVSAQNEYVAGKGRHIITLLDGQMIEFDEEDNTWEIIESGS